MRLNQYETQRALTLPGLTITAKLDPTTFGVRIRNAAAKMLRSGVIHGGHRSMAARLAMLMASENDLPCSRTYWHTSMKVTGPLNEAVAFQLSELIMADFADFMLEYGSQSHASANYVHIKREQANDCIAVLKRTGNATVQFHSKVFFDKALDVLTAHRSPELVAQADRLINIINGRNLIEINNFHNTTK
jgi:hypothetical protein